jgi:hypothetical protein
MHFMNEKLSTNFSIDTVETEEDCQSIARANPVCSPLIFCRQLLEARRAAKRAKNLEEAELEIASCLPPTKLAIYDAISSCDQAVSLFEAKCPQVMARVDYAVYAVESLISAATDANYQGISTSSNQEFKVASFRNMTQMTKIAIQAAQVAVEFARVNVDGARSVVDKAGEADLFEPLKPGGEREDYDWRMPMNTTIDTSSRTGPRPTTEQFRARLAAVAAAVKATSVPNDNWHIPDAQYNGFHTIHVHLQSMHDKFTNLYSVVMSKPETGHAVWGQRSGWWRQGETRTRMSGCLVEGVMNSVRHAQQFVGLARDALICADEVRRQTTDRIKDELVPLGPSRTLIPKQLEGDSLVDNEVGGCKYHWDCATVKTADARDIATHVTRAATSLRITSRPLAYARFEKK